MQRSKKDEIRVALSLVVVLVFVIAFAVILTLSTSENGSIINPKTLTLEADITSLATHSNAIDRVTEVAIQPSTESHIVMQTTLPATGALTENAAIPTSFASSTYDLGQEFPTTSPTVTPARLTPSEEHDVADVASVVARERDTAAITSTAMSHPVITTQLSSDTPTATLTLTGQPTETATFTAIPSLAPTLTSTQTPSATRTLTPTDFPSHTPTPTATITVSPSPTVTLTLTLTETITLTVTPSRTPSQTSTSSPTSTSSRTPHPTETSGILPTLTPTPTPEALAQTTDCVVPEGWIAYKVRPGNTLFLIARAVGVTIAELGRANCLNDLDRILAGEDLYVPGNLAPVDYAGTGSVFDRIGCGNPNVVITRPIPGQNFASAIVVHGSANLPAQDYYKLEIRSDGHPIPSFWSMSNEVVVDGYLGLIDPSVFSPGKYSIRLVVVDLSGNIPQGATCEIPVIID